jgi:uncharacterized protein (DUF433 family)
MSQGSAGDWLRVWDGARDLGELCASALSVRERAIAGPAGGPRRGARIEARLAFGHARRHLPIMLNWSQCAAVERIPGKVSGVWLFKGTRVPVQALFENLESGATVENFLEWFPGVAREQVEAVLEHAQRSLVET